MVLISIFNNFYCHNNKIFSKKCPDSSDFKKTNRILTATFFSAQFFRLYL
jgi:hypothetical protein